MMTVASSVPMSIGKRYLNDTFEKDHRLRRLSGRSIETPFPVRVLPQNNWALKRGVFNWEVGTQ
jgi:hypothetical protein